MLNGREKKFPLLVGSLKNVYMAIKRKIFPASFFAHWLCPILGAKQIIEISPVIAALTGLDLSAISEIDHIRYSTLVLQITRLDIRLLGDRVPGSNIVTKLRERVVNFLRLWR